MPSFQVFSLDDIYNMSIYKINKYFERIGKGSSRAVYAIDSMHVIKVAVNNYGDYQCRIEDRIYRHSEIRFRKYLCPVLWYKRGMIVMVRAVPYKKRYKGEHFNITNIRPNSECKKDIKEFCRRFDLFYNDVRSPTSWGDIKGVPYLIDYGCTNSIFDEYYR